MRTGLYCGYMNRMFQQLVAVIHAEPVATLGGLVVSLAILFSGVWR